MTDRQLLEDAAKAAGIEYGWQHIFSDYEGSTADKWDWNPLTSDGDALRLAARLHMFDTDRFMAIRLEETRIDPTRDDNEIICRAITRAAAEIGRAMP